MWRDVAPAETPYKCGQPRLYGVFGVCFSAQGEKWVARAQSRYQITALAGQRLKFRKRHEFPSEQQAVIDAAGGKRSFWTGG